MPYQLLELNRIHEKTSNSYTFTIPEQILDKVIYKNTAFNITP